MRSAVEIVDRCDILGRVLRPGHGHEAAFDRPEQHVAVALVKDKAGLGDVLTGDIKHHRRDRQEAAVAPRGRDLVAAQDLAALNAAQVGPYDVNIFDLRIGSKEGRCLGFALRRHDGHFKSPEGLSLARRMGGGTTPHGFAHQNLI